MPSSEETARREMVHQPWGCFLGEGRFRDHRGRGPESGLGRERLLRLGHWSPPQSSHVTRPSRGSSQKLLHTKKLLFFQMQLKSSHITFFFFL